MSRLERLEVIIEAPMAPFKKSMNEAKNTTRNVTNSINKDLESVQSKLSGTSYSSQMGKLRNMMDSVMKPIREYRANAGFSDEGLASSIGGILKEKVNDRMLGSGIKEYTAEYEQAAQAADRVSRSLEKLEEKQRDLDAAGVKHDSDEWNKVAEKIRQAEKALGSYTGQMRRMEGTGQSTKFVGFKSIAGSAVSKAFSGMQSVFSKVTSGIKQCGGAAASLIQKFSSGVPILRRFTNNLNNTGRSGRNLKGIFGAVATSLKFMLASFLIRQPINMAKEGFQNLAQYSESTNASLSTLMSGLTQLKNSFATAFAPILNVVTPILDTLIQKISQAVSSIGMLFSSLTGQTTFTKAKKVQQDYAASLDSTSKSADKAKRSILGFDEINKLDDNSGTSSGGLSPADMFGDVPIANKASEFAEKIKEAWRNADFTEIGTILGDKLNSAMESIPWGKIRGTSKRIAESIATLLNGFNKETDWNLFGQTIANGLNTGIDFAYEFVTTFSWKSFGDAIANSINGAVSTLEWAKIGQTISGAVKGLLDLLIAAIEGTDWKAVGESLKEVIVNIDWNGIADRLFELLGAAIGGLAAFLTGLIGDAWTSVVNWWHDVAYEDGKFTITGLLNGIVDVLSNIAQWIYDHIFRPFFDGFRKAFGIHSPSTVMAEQGGYIIQGLLNGLTNGITSVLEWFRKLPTRIKTAVGNLRDFGKSMIQSFIDGFKSIHIPTPHFETTGTVTAFGIDTKIPKIGVKWYASGGYPQLGEMFVARENGPELVGRMGRKNAVANNDQIVEGIKAGVMDGIIEAMMMFNKESDSDQAPTVEVTIVADSEQAAKFVRKGEKKLDRRYQTVIVL